MVSGTVADMEILDEAVWLLVFNPASVEQEMGILIENTWAAQCIHAGDNVSWQSANLYWTPKSQAFKAHRIAKLSRAHVPRPEPSFADDEKVVTS